MAATKSSERKEKMADLALASLSTRHVFRGIEYVVSVFLRGEVVIVEVEDRLTADQWRGEFNARYVEDLTHKTGNFKQFKVFVNMLESALNKDSSSVSLDLLTYADLQNLREQKPGVSTSIPAARAMSQLATKRYLILTYTVEFDRIHYPLPLPYVGKPDPVHLQDINRKLKEEIKNLKNQLTKDAKTFKAEQKQKQLDNLINEKENLEKEYGAFQREVKHSSLADTAKEIKVLKKVIKNLEGELLKEKTKYQRMLSKKTQENRDVLEELKEARANERNLRARCRNLTNELALLKRQGAKIRQSPSVGAARTSSAKKTNHIPRRSTSQERKVTPQTRRRTRSPSPAALPRFDPTAYVKEKQQKLKETKESRSRKRTRSGQSNTRGRSLSSDRGSGILRTRPQDPNRGVYRTSSLSSIGSRRSSGSTGRQHFRDQEAPRRRSGSQRRGRSRVPGSDGSSADGSEAEGRKKYFRTIYSSTPQDLKRATAPKRGDKVLETSLNRSVEMSEIDARLNALQQFMKENME